MSTRSFIGAMTESGRIGVYCHSDGYPTHNGRQVQAILKRDGFEKFLDVILNQANQSGFSYLDAAETATGENTLGDRAELIAGYGRVYRDCDAQPPQTLGSAMADDSWQEYGYVIRPDNTIEVYDFRPLVKRWVIGVDDPIDSDEAPDHAEMIERNAAV
ncbi:hypothetical protein K8O93_00985 [Gordonia bronchialis]|uniref:hypothetical protein n=1 Tax=Gordonia bronchialis TaxID=2054 RepID=UPI001CBCEB8B|nr:hypothetical protein [Gordonia bronchialis]UAK38408.1 hypothetical protein K8O93_00985 [Gordonia bronchialis]